METIRVLVNGAKGRMGSEAARAVQEANDMALVAQIDQGDDLVQTISLTQAQVVVDFTVPSSAYRNAKRIQESGAGGVIGTTGFKPEEIEALKKACNQRHPAILIAPNFAIGALLMMHLSQIAAKHLPDIEIIEQHHPGKLDAPSGTAIKTAELITHSKAEASDKGNFSQEVPRGTSPRANEQQAGPVSQKTEAHPFQEGARGQCFHGIPIHSVRLPGMLAHQEVIFGGEGQTLRIRHDTLNRRSFMPGVLMGIREVVKRQGLIYGLDNILFDK